MLIINISKDFITPIIFEYIDNIKCQNDTNLRFIFILV